MGVRAPTGSVLCGLASGQARDMGPQQGWSAGLTREVVPGPYEEPGRPCQGGWPGSLPSASWPCVVCLRGRGRVEACGRPPGSRRCFSLGLDRGAR